MRPKYELADILVRYGDRFRNQQKPLKYHLKVLNAIQKCRTVALGGHVEQCSECGEIRISYNSCRNRHCPKCQNTNRDKWIAARQKDLLDCKYYHLVFTLPEVLNSFCLHYPKEMYNILFFASKETLMTFGRDEKHLGADMGAISILHTWGQNLSLHPHVHMIVPGGGIDKSGHWKHSKVDGKYLFPVKAMSTVYRGKFMEKFRTFLQESGMELTADLRHKLYAENWVVFAKRPFGGPEQVIEYLGRYTHKIAISNHRLQRIDGRKISFTYKDYRGGYKIRVMTLDAIEFLRRFCLHILPGGFRKIRHYGILASRNKPKLKAQQDRMGIDRKEIIESTYDKIKGSTFKPKQCPCCQKETMQQVMCFDPAQQPTFKANAPPPLWLLTNETKNPKITKQ